MMTIFLLAWCFVGLAPAGSSEPLLSALCMFASLFLKGMSSAANCGVLKVSASVWQKEKGNAHMQTPHPGPLTGWGRSHSDQENRCETFIPRKSL